MQLEYARQLAVLTQSHGTPCFSPSARGSVLEERSALPRCAAACSIQSLPFLEGLLLGALWAAGVREKVGSVLSKKETASSRKGGEVGRGSMRSLGTKQPRAHSTSALSQSGAWEGIRSLGLGGFTVSLLESVEPGRLSLVHCVPLLMPFIYFIPVKLRDKGGGCWLLEAFYFPPGPSGPHAVCHSPFRLL